MCSYIKASPTVISDHPRDTPLALPPPAPVQQPLGGRVWGFPEDALEINHLLIRNLKIISMDNVCRTQPQCEIKLWFTLGGKKGINQQFCFFFLLPADRSSGWELLKPGNNHVDQVTLQDVEGVCSTPLTLSDCPSPTTASVASLKNDYKPPEFDPVHQIGLQYGGRRHISARPQQRQPVCRCSCAAAPKMVDAHCRKQAQAF